MKAVPRRPRDPREITHDASDLWFNALHGDAAEVANVIRSVPDGAVNHRGVRQWTCLFAAATRGHVEVARLLLEHGADPELEMEQGWRALMTAAQQGFAPIVQLLLEHGADPGARNKNGDTALTLAEAANHKTALALMRAPPPALKSVQPPETEPSLAPATPFVLVLPPAPAPAPAPLASIEEEQEAANVREVVSRRERLAARLSVEIGGVKTERATSVGQANVPAESALQIVKGPTDAELRQMRVKQMREEQRAAVAAALAAKTPTVPSPALQAAPATPSAILSKSPAFRSGATTPMTRGTPAAPSTAGSTSSAAPTVIVTLSRTPNESLGLGLGFDGDDVVVKAIGKDTPAMRCGLLRVGDRVVSINGEPVSARSDIRALMTASSAVTLEIEQAVEYGDVDDDETEAPVGKRDFNETEEAPESVSPHAPESLPAPAPAPALANAETLLRVRVAAAALSTEPSAAAAAAAAERLTAVRAKLERLEALEEDAERAALLAAAVPAQIAAIAADEAEAKGPQSPAEKLVAEAKRLMAEVEASEAIGFAMSAVEVERLAAEADQMTEAMYAQAQLLADEVAAESAAEEEAEDMAMDEYAADEAMYVQAKPLSEVEAARAAAEHAHSMHRESLTYTEEAPVTAPSPSRAPALWAAARNAARVAVTLERTPNESLGLGLDFDGDAVVLQAIGENSPAQRSGQLRAGDRVLSMNGEPVSTASDLGALLKHATTIILEVERAPEVAEAQPSPRTGATSVKSMRAVLAAHFQRDAKPPVPVASAAKPAAPATGTATGTPAPGASSVAAEAAKLAQQKLKAWDHLVSPLEQRAAAARAAAAKPSDPRGPTRFATLRPVNALGTAPEGGSGSGSGPSKSGPSKSGSGSDVALATSDALFSAAADEEPRRSPRVGRAWLAAQIAKLEQGAENAPPPLPYDEPRLFDKRSLFGYGRIRENARQSIVNASPSVPRTVSPTVSSHLDTSPTVSPPLGTPPMAQAQASSPEVQTIQTALAEAHANVEPALQTSMLPEPLGAVGSARRPSSFGTVLDPPPSLSANPSPLTDDNAQLLPVSARSSAPVSARGSAPVSARGSAPVSARGSAPNSARGSAPNSARGSAPNSARSPGSARGPGPVEVEAMRRSSLERRLKAFETAAADEALLTEQGQAALAELIQDAVRMRLPPALTATARRKLHAAKEEYQTPHGYTPMGYKKVHVGGGETLRMRPMPALGNITPQADLYEFSARATSARGEGARPQYGAHDLEPIAVSETEEAALAADQMGATASAVATPPAPSPLAAPTPMQPTPMQPATVGARRPSSFGTVRPGVGAAPTPMQPTPVQPATVGARRPSSFGTVQGVRPSAAYNAMHTPQYELSVHESAHMDTRTPWTNQSTNQLTNQSMNQSTNLPDVALEAEAVDEPAVAAESEMALMAVEADPAGAAPVNDDADDADDANSNNRWIESDEALLKASASLLRSQRFGGETESSPLQPPLTAVVAAAEPTPVVERRRFSSFAEAAAVPTRRVSSFGTTMSVTAMGVAEGAVISPRSRRDDLISPVISPVRTTGAVAGDPAEGLWTFAPLRHGGGAEFRREVRAATSHEAHGCAEAGGDSPESSSARGSPCAYDVDGWPHLPTAKLGAQALLGAESATASATASCTSSRWCSSSSSIASPAAPPSAPAFAELFDKHVSRTVSPVAAPPAARPVPPAVALPSQCRASAIASAIGSGGSVGSGSSAVVSTGSPAHVGSLSDRIEIGMPPIPAADAARALADSEQEHMSVVASSRRVNDVPAEARARAALAIISETTVSLTALLMATYEADAAEEAAAQVASQARLSTLASATRACCRRGIQALEAQRDGVLAARRARLGMHGPADEALPERAAPHQEAELARLTAKMHAASQSAQAAARAAVSAKGASPIAAEKQMAMREWLKANVSPLAAEEMRFGSERAADGFFENAEGAAAEAERALHAYQNELALALGAEAERLERTIEAIGLAMRVAGPALHRAANQVSVVLRALGFFSGGLVEMPLLMLPVRLDRMMTAGSTLHTPRSPDDGAGGAAARTSFGDAFTYHLARGETPSTRTSDAANDAVSGTLEVRFLCAQTLRAVGAPLLIPDGRAVLSIAAPALKLSLCAIEAILMAGRPFSPDALLACMELDEATAAAAAAAEAASTPQSAAVGAAAAVLEALSTTQALVDVFLDPSLWNPADLEAAAKAGWTPDGVEIARLIALSLSHVFPTFGMGSAVPSGKSSILSSSQLLLTQELTIGGFRVLAAHAHAQGTLAHGWERMTDLAGASVWVGTETTQKWADDLGATGFLPLRTKQLPTILPVATILPAEGTSPLQVQLPESPVLSDASRPPSMSSAGAITYSLDPEAPPALSEAFTILTNSLVVASKRSAAHIVEQTASVTAQCVAGSREELERWQRSREARAIAKWGTQVQENVVAPVFGAVGQAALKCGETMVGALTNRDRDGYRQAMEAMEVRMHQTLRSSLDAHQLSIQQIALQQMQIQMQQQQQQLAQLTHAQYSQTYQMLPSQPLLAGVPSATIHPATALQLERLATELARVHKDLAEVKASAAPIAPEAAAAISGAVGAAVAASAKADAQPSKVPSKAPSPPAAAAAALEGVRMDRARMSTPPKGPVPDEVLKGAIVKGAWPVRVLELDEGPDVTA